jgi:nucleoside-diphosphate-sugar epimerase
MPSPSTEAELEELLSRPTPGVLDTLRRNPGDLLVLGAGGKMGPSLAVMARRALDQIGSKAKVIAASRFSEAGLRQRLEQAGVETRQLDLLDAGQLATLPEAPNLIFMAGQKFGTQGNPAITWAMNASLPTLVSRRFPGARTVVFSTGNVYPLTPAGGPGPDESHPVGPIGEYAMSCLARERVFQYAALSRDTPVLIFRLNYAVELRYGVLVDTATRILLDQPVPLAMGQVNLIWQGDANARAIQCLDHTASPAAVLNVTGPERLSIRSIAERFGQILGKRPRFEGTEAADALLSDARRSVELFGPPTIPVTTVIQWTADWLRQGGRLLGKPTHFEERTGRF